MNGARQLSCDVDAELLVELADQRRLRRLAGMHLAAGKFPEAGEMLAGRPLGQQHAAVGVDQRHRRDEDDRPRGLRPSIASPARPDTGSSRCLTPILEDSRLSCGSCR